MPRLRLRVGRYGISGLLPTASGTAILARAFLCTRAMSVVVAFVLGALGNAGFPTQFSGVLDDAAFPAEERTTLSTIMMPVLVEANASTGTAVLRDPGAGVSFTASVGETARDYVLVAILPGVNASAVLERRFARFGVFVYLQPGAPPLVLRKAVGNLETVQRQAATAYSEQYYDRFARERRDVLGEAVLAATAGEPTYEDVQPALSPIAPYATIGSYGEGTKFTMCPDGVIKLSNGTLREPAATGAPGTVVFDPALRGVSGARNFSDSVGGLLGFLPAACYGFSDSVSGAGWEIVAFAKAGATTAEPEPLFVRLTQLGGRVDYFRVGAGSSSGPLEPTRAATHFFQALLELHGSFARFLLPPCAAEVTLPYAERRLPGMSRAGLAQALATYDGVHQRYGTGVDYYAGTKQLMTVAVTVNAALLAWGV